MNNNERDFKVEIVERINSKKKRAFRVIFPLDGVKDLIEPSTLNKATAKIIKDIGSDLLKKADYILALDRGGLILGLSLSLSQNIPLKIAWKHNLQLDSKTALTDPYIPDEPLYAYGLKKGDRVVLVDDEVYSGETLIETISCLNKVGVKVLTALVLVECLNFNAKKKISKYSCDLKSYKKYRL